MPRRRDQTDANRRYYWDHRRQEIDRVLRRQADQRSFLATVKDRPCTDCGARVESHQMDFDHRDPSTKSFWLSSGTALLAGRDRLLREIAKCDVVCANCHRTRTRAAHQARLEARGPSTAKSRYIERMRKGWRSDAEFLDELRSVPCADCNVQYPPWAMDFDHRDPDRKTSGVSRLVGHGRRRLLAEVELCDIVCANCHRSRTFDRQRAMQLARE
jgi:hypothetical protein